MGNTTYSFSGGCNDGQCPSETCKQLFLTSNTGAETMNIVRDGGFYPIKELVDFFHSCDSSGNLSLPCPTSKDERSQSCKETCPSGMAYYYDPTDLGSGKLCRPDSYNYVTSDTLALAIVFQYLSTLSRIADLVDGNMDIALDMWPEFYHFYNNSYGQTDVDLFIKKYNDAGTPLPQKAIDVLKSNFEEGTQQLYGLLNGYDWANSTFSGTWQVGGDGGDEHSVPITTISPNWALMMTFGDDVTYITTPDQYLKLFKDYYRRKTIADTDFYEFEYGNPFWTDAQRKDAYRKAVGKWYPKDAPDIASGRDWIDIWSQAYVNAGLIKGGKSADDYFDPDKTPGMTNPYEGSSGGIYDGQLPKLENVEFAGDLIHRQTTDTTTHGYKNECDSKSIIEKILPIGCGIVGGAVSGMIIPGNLAKAAAFGVGGFSCYSVVSSVYGEQAEMWWGTTKRNDGEKLAARLISFGLPATFMFGMVELGYVPALVDTFAKKTALVAAFGGVGYVVLNPGLEQSLIIGGDVVEIVLSPIGFVDRILHNIFDGCDKHTSNSDQQCYCENANSKILLSEALVYDLYGATDAQAKLRLDCMHAATTQGSWGTDPVHMGTCDTSTGWMDTPTACVSAGQFAYNQFDPTMPLAQQMHDEIQHCVSASNPSFLPPSPLFDAECAHFGPFARQGGVILGGSTVERWPGSEKGKCYDFRAPPAQSELGLSSSYDWKKIEPPKSNECSIL